MQTKINYIIATTPKDFEAASTLFKEYAAWLNIDLCFQNFNTELQDLANMYSLKNGGIVLCKEDEQYIGCSAIRKKENNSCELKRMWVQPNHQGKKFGEQLLIECIAIAKKLNYNSIKLDTLRRLIPAIELYKKFGFKEVEPYYNNPNVDVVYMELKL